MTQLTVPGPLVSPEWLASHINEPNIVILDSSLKPITTSVCLDGPTEILGIPRTRRFDFDKKICDQTSTLPHMMPSPELFEKEVRELGVCKDSMIVIYDNVGVYSSPRAWWMFQAMGHKNVAILNGGLPAWIAKGFSVEPLIAPSTKIGDFLAKPQKGFICNADEVLLSLKDTNSVVLDARSTGRFLGTEPEPRQGLRPGHMPGAKNLPFLDVQENGHMRSIDSISKILAPIANPNQKLFLVWASLGIPKFFVVFISVQYAGS